MINCGSWLVVVGGLLSTLLMLASIRSSYLLFTFFLALLASLANKYIYSVSTLFRRKIINNKLAILPLRDIVCKNNDKMTDNKGEIEIKKAPDLRVACGTDEEEPFKMVKVKHQYS